VGFTPQIFVGAAVVRVDGCAGLRIPPFAVVFFVVVVVVIVVVM